MNRSEYMKLIEDLLGGGEKPTCQDCGEPAAITHGIVDHESDTVRLVCDECFNATYKGWIYGNPAKH